MIVLGIDPGSQNTGYGILDCQGNNNLSCLTYGNIGLNPREDFNLRLKEIYDKIEQLILQHQPVHVALEDVFFSRNIKVALHLGQARGAAIIAALNHKRQIFSYSPREIKQALTGHGNASKEQIKRMAENILQVDLEGYPLDVSDALSIAICHAFRRKTISYGSCD
jgi:crossover junction endodeoxyribonuclease RuvC